MSQDKSKNYDFDADDPFSENLLEGHPDKGSLKQEALGEDDQDFVDFDAVEEAHSALKTAPEDVRPSTKPGMKDGVVGFLKENYLYVVGGVVVLVILYYMYGMIFPSTPSEAARPAASSQQQGFGVAVQPMPTKKTASAPVQQQTSGQNQTPTMAFTQDDLKQMIDGFSSIVDQKNQALAQQITAISQAQTQLTQQEASLNTNLASELGQLNTQIKSLNTAIDSSNKSMADISQALLRTQSQLKLLLAQKAQDRDQLSLRAVVSGRAWLVDGTGRTISVMVGDEIQNYGKVERIDAKTATVIMSSGYVFN